MIYLLLAFLICSFGAYISYSPMKAEPYARWLMMCLGGLIGWLWIVAIRKMDSERAYVFSLYWDSVVMTAYYLMPILLLGVRPNAGVLVGSAVVMAGLVIVKIYA